MAKVTKKAFEPKLAVEEYRQSGEQIECDCFIPGDNRDDTFTKMVSLVELYYHVKGEKNRVWVTNQGDSENCYPVMFDQWYEDNRYNLHEVLADIINKKEGRNLVAEMPDVFATLGKILNPYPSTIMDHSQILNNSLS